MRLLRNETRGNQHFLSLRLMGKTCNRDAIGARVVVKLGEPPHRTLSKTMRAGDSFIAQSSKWRHFGLGTNTQIAEVVVHWPGGEKESFGGFEADRQYKIVQGTGAAVLWPPPRESTSLTGGPVSQPEASPTKRTWIVGRVPLPAASYKTWDNTRAPLDAHQGRPLLINLWSPTCRSCLAELSEWSEQHSRLKDANLQILALSVDELADAGDRQDSPAQRTVQRLDLPFITGKATGDLVRVLEIVHRAYVERQRPLPVPSSVLIDGDGKVAAIYKGRVDVEQLLRDVQSLDGSAEAQRDAALPFSGRWRTPPFAANPRLVLGRFVAAGQPDEALAYVKKVLSQSGADASSASVADLHELHGNLLWDRGEVKAAAVEFAKLLIAAPCATKLHRELGQRLLLEGLTREALSHLRLAARQSPRDVDLQLNVAMQSMQIGELDSGIFHFRSVLKLQPNAAVVHYHLANALLAKRDVAGVVEHFRHAHRLKPNSQAANNLAWLLATCGVDAIRNGPEAVALSEQICRKNRFSDPSSLDTLAAAYAEVGRFEEAVRTVSSAIAIAGKKGAKSMVTELRRRLRQYEKKRPHREIPYRRPPK